MALHLSHSEETRPQQIRDTPATQTKWEISDEDFQNDLHEMTFVIYTLHKLLKPAILCAARNWEKAHMTIGRWKKITLLSFSSEMEYI